MLTSSRRWLREKFFFQGNAGLVSSFVLLCLCWWYPTLPYHHTILTSEVGVSTYSTIPKIPLRTKSSRTRKVLNYCHTPTKNETSPRPCSLLPETSSTLTNERNSLPHTVCSCSTMTMNSLNDTNRPPGEDSSVDDTGDQRTTEELFEHIVDMRTRQCLQLSLPAVQVLVQKFVPTNDYINPTSSHSQSDNTIHVLVHKLLAFYRQQIHIARAPDKAATVRRAAFNQAKAFTAALDQAYEKQYPLPSSHCSGELSLPPSAPLHSTNHTSQRRRSLIEKMATQSPVVLTRPVAQGANSASVAVSHAATNAAASSSSSSSSSSHVPGTTSVSTQKTLQNKIRNPHKPPSKFLTPEQRILLGTAFRMKNHSNAKTCQEIWQIITETPRTAQQPGLDLANFSRQQIECILLMLQRVDQTKSNDNLQDILRAYLAAFPSPDTDKTLAPDADGRTNKTVNAGQSSAVTLHQNKSTSPLQASNTSPPPPPPPRVDAEHSPRGLEGRRTPPISVQTTNTATTANHDQHGATQPLKATGGSTAHNETRNRAASGTSTANTAPAAGSTLQKLSASTSVSSGDHSTKAVARTVGKQAGRTAVSSKKLSQDDLRYHLRTNISACPPRLQRHLEEVANQGSVPRTRAAFLNYAKTRLRVTEKCAIEIWDEIERILLHVSKQKESQSCSRNNGTVSNHHSSGVDNQSSRPPNTSNHARPAHPPRPPPAARSEDVSCPTLGDGPNYSSSHVRPPPPPPPSNKAAERAPPMANPIAQSQQNKKPKALSNTKNGVKSHVKFPEQSVTTSTATTIEMTIVEDSSSPSFANACIPKEIDNGVPKLKIRGRTTIKFLDQPVSSQALREIGDRIHSWLPFWDINAYVRVFQTQTVPSEYKTPQTRTAFHASSVMLNKPYSHGGRIVGKCNIAADQWGMTRVNADFESGETRLLLLMLPKKPPAKKKADGHQWPKGTFLQLTTRIKGVELPTPIRLTQRKQESHDLTSWKGMCRVLDLTQHISDPECSITVEGATHDDEPYYCCIVYAQYRTPEAVLDIMMDFKHADGMKRLTRLEGEEKARSFASSTMVVLDSDDEKKDGAEEEESAKFIVSLTDSYSKVLIRKPVRGTKCKHFQVSCEPWKQKVFPCTSSQMFCSAST